MTIIKAGLSGSETALSPAGRSVSIVTFEVGRSGRVMSGKYVKDITATKHQIVLKYSKTTGVTLMEAEALADIGGEINLEVYDEIHTYRNYKVLLEPFRTGIISSGGRLKGLHSFTLTFTEV